MFICIYIYVYIYIYLSIYMCTKRSGGVAPVDGTDSKVPRSFLHPNKSKNKWRCGTSGHIQKQVEVRHQWTEQTARSPARFSSRTRAIISWRRIPCR